MSALISDRTKFREITEPIENFTRKAEGKINRFLSKLKKLKLISEDTYRKLYASGTGPGLLYGLPKIHKPDFSTNFKFRPIFAAYNTPSYSLAKFLVPILAPLTSNEFTVKNSYSFVEEICKLNGAKNCFMASFDVESLFTNIPLHETIEICIKCLFTNTKTVLQFSSELFRHLLSLAVCNTFFLFNGKYYQQIDGLGMGLPLGPTFANIFMCFYEKIWLHNCPSEFKPLFYRRYIDDTFLLFREESHVKMFLDYLNSQHSNIKFTSEVEKNCKLNFLDVTVTRGSTFRTSVFRKPTFTGLGTSFFSFCPFRFKITSIQTLICRAYRICSDFHTLHTEFDFLRRFFKKNGYPLSLVDKYIRRFLDSLYTKRPSSVSEDTRDFYISLPFFGYQSEKLKTELLSILSKFYSGINFKIILVNPFRIGSFFHYKDRIPKGMQASLVYEFSCVRGRTSVSYVGSTKRHLYERVAEHANRSARTGLSFSTPSNSSIKTHSDSCVCDISVDNFRILGSCCNELDLRILESLYIHRRKPNLNDHLSAFPLSIVN